ncbi:MAG: 50S ribosomal protein L32 [Candidatus Omnitrophica bacterium]|nr:50S ribosomal protein L32 [Candidatus Omnitrophota bacterium]
MAHPKRQHSVQRRRKRQTHQKVDVPNLSVCSQCQKPIIPHRVCPFCGFYKDKPVVDMTVKEKKDKKEK